MPTVNYHEGDLFAVPLREGGFALGLVARANRDGVLFGYFFGPKYDSLPSLDLVGTLRVDDAILIRMFGHLGLLRGEWPILGQVPGWCRSDWYIPGLYRCEELTGRSFLVFYDDRNPNHMIREEELAPDSAVNQPKDGLSGAGAIEIVLTSLLR
jgi:hypothetical protein